VAIAKQNMTEGKEDVLAVKVWDAADRCCLFQPRKILQPAKDIVKACKPKEPKPIFGKNWVSHFMVRHGIKMYCSKKISNKHLQSTSPHNIGEYSDKLKDCQEN
jgi:hypothetical protein